MPYKCKVCGYVTDNSVPSECECGNESTLKWEMVSEEAKKEEGLKIENAVRLYRKRLKYYKKHGRCYANRKKRTDPEMEELKQYMSFNPFCERNYIYEEWKWNGAGEAHYQCNKCEIGVICKLALMEEYERALKLLDVFEDKLKETGKTPDMFRKKVFRQDIDESD